MDLTYYGQSCFLLTTVSYRLLFDPMITGNPLARHIDVQDIMCDYILLSHGHGDHCADAEAIGRRCGSTLISCYETVAWYEKKGIKGHPMNTGGKWTFPFGTLKYVAAVHSSELPDGTYGGQAGGFVLWNDEGCLYFAGDTALTMDMQLIPLTCPPLTAAILPLGDNFTMGYEDAVIAAEFTKAKRVIGCHYDTFDLIQTDHSKIKKAFSEAGIEILLPEPGQTITV